MNVVNLDPPEAGAWLVFPEAGKRAGEGGDCYQVTYFDDELAALRYANQRNGYRAVPIKPGQTILDAIGATFD
ncbi:hypothetical protein [Nocardia xishanensis]|uniref:hypothetical protein n=1 Tax=Nocardia xishanensis TaxID=238964 RepID=UPI000A61A50F|nr:hypothetical protein [Nocardia xishanensis]